MSTPAADVGAPSPGRAGRNVPIAVITGLGLALLVLVSLYTVKVAFVVVVALAASMAIVELVTAMRTGGVAVPVGVVIAGGVAMLGLAYFDGADALASAYAVTCVLVVLGRVVHGPQGLVRDATVSVLVATYVPLLASFAMLMLAQPQGADRVLVFILAVVLNDTGGLVAGMAVGKHKLAPTVSPKKSWEGLGGSFVAAVVGSAVALPLLLGTTWWQGVLFGVVVVATATVGDLGESLIKRDLGVKDMGWILPAHGGLMDRLDSLLPTAPVAFLLLGLMLR